MAKGVVCLPGDAGDRLAQGAGVRVHPWTIGRTLQRFVGERIEVQASEDGEFATREAGNGERQVFEN